jgi:hypothetical protein
LGENIERERLGGVGPGSTPAGAHVHHKPAHKHPQFQDFCANYSLYSSRGGYDDGYQNGGGSNGYSNGHGGGYGGGGYGGGYGGGRGGGFGGGAGGDRMSNLGAGLKKQDWGKSPTLLVHFS